MLEHIDEMIDHRIEKYEKEINSESSLFDIEKMTGWIEGLNEAKNILEQEAAGKSVLIMDTPKSCGKCKLCNAFFRCFITKKDLRDIRPDINIDVDCPLKTLDK